MRIGSELSEDTYAKVRESGHKYFKLPDKFTSFRSLERLCSSENVIRTKVEQGYCKRDINYMGIRKTALR